MFILLRLIIIKVGHGINSIVNTILNFLYSRAPKVGGLEIAAPFKDLSMGNLNSGSDYYISTKAFDKAKRHPGSV